jgi:hypothetical protein
MYLSFILWGYSALHILPTSFCINNFQLQIFLPGCRIPKLAPAKKLDIC